MANTFNNGLIPLGTAFGSTFEETVTLGFDMGSGDSSVATIDYATITTPLEVIPAPRNDGFIRILSWELVSAGTVAVTLKDNDAAITGAISLAVATPNVLPHNIGGWFDLGPGQPLNIVLSAGVQVSGVINYTTFGER